MSNDGLQNSKWVLAFWGWIAVWIIAFLVVYKVYVHFLGLMIFTFPLLMVLFFIPLFFFADKAKFSFSVRLPPGVKKIKYQTLFMGILMIPMGLTYYFEQWDYKYKIHVPSSTGIVFIAVGIIFIIFSVVKRDNS